MGAWRHLEYVRGQNRSCCLTDLSSLPVGENDVWEYKDGATPKLLYRFRTARLSIESLTSTSVPHLKLARSALKPTGMRLRRAIHDRVMSSHTADLTSQLYLLVAARRCYAVLVYLPHMRLLWYIMQYDTIPSPRP